ncbi:MAG: insulinase family protein [Clostridia bacterium]|nr:insulinase family protein [Clostridia bacterium]
MEKTKISSGVNLYTLNINKFKTFTVSMYIHRKLNESEASLNALLPFVMKRGSKKYPDTVAVSETLESLYGGFFDCFIRKKGENQIIAFNFEFVAPQYIPNDSDYVNGVFGFINDMLFNPLTNGNSFNEEYVEREKQNLKDYIEGIINDKKEYANKRCIEELCEGEAYAVYEYGSVENLDKINAKNLYEHYVEIMKTSVIDVFVIGDIDSSPLKNALADSIKRDDVKEGYHIAKIKAPCDKVKVVTDKMEVNQGKLAMGFTTETAFDDEDSYALTMFNSVYGSGAHSKLFNNVREKLSLCYYAYSRLDKHKGIMLVNSGVEFENFEKAYNEILAQLECVKKGEISDMEITAAKKYLVNMLRSLNDSAFSIEDFYLSGVITGNITTIEEYIENIEKVTKEQIVEVAKKVKLNTVYYLTGKGE